MNSEIAILKESSSEKKQISRPIVDNENAVMCMAATKRGNKCMNKAFNTSNGIPLCLLHSKTISRSTPEGPQ